MEDTDAVHAYASDIDNIRYMIWGPNERKDTEAFIAECLRKEAQTPRLSYDFAITLNGELIGACGLYLNAEMTEGMLGWILRKDHWKKGYMPEAAKALLKLGFEELHLHRIYAACNAENYGSRRVMEKCGMRREAHFIRNRYGRVGTQNMWYDEYQYAMLAEEWRETPAEIRQIEDAEEKTRIARVVLEALPGWFGIPEARENYIRGSRGAAFFAAVADGAAAGFIALAAHNPYTAEIDVMGVLPSCHRQGIGRALVRKAEAYCRAGGYALLEVKTPGPSRESAEYAGTRAFYNAVGFLPLECIPQVWGHENPCLVMVKPL
jgi:RimJ/RimL family protein N-acetyltransferase/predicted GNAT family acetyltransferase